jgi:hypothetical protein
MGVFWELLYVRIHICVFEIVKQRLVLAVMVGMEECGGGFEVQVARHGDQGWTFHHVETMFVHGVSDARILQVSINKFATINFTIVLMFEGCSSILSYRLYYANYYFYRSIQNFLYLHTVCGQTCGPLEFLRFASSSRTIQQLPRSHLKRLNHLFSYFGRSSGTQCGIKRIRKLIINHQIDLCLHPRRNFRSNFLRPGITRRTRFVGKRTQCPTRPEVGEDCSVASGILRGVWAVAVVFDARCRNSGVCLSTDGLDDEVGGCTVNATVERFTHHILISNDQFCFFGPYFAFSVWRGVFGDVGGDAEGQEFVVALDVGDNCVEGFCVVG